MRETRGCVYDRDLGAVSENLEPSNLPSHRSMLLAPIVREFFPQDQPSLLKATCKLAKVEMDRGASRIVDGVEKSDRGGGGVSRRRRLSARARGETKDRGRPRMWNNITMEDSFFLFCVIK
jgi:hypothetical protein